MLCGGSGASAANPVRFLLPPAAETAAPHRYPDLYGAHAAAEAAAAEAAANAETQLPACDVEMGAAEESPEEQTQPDARAGLNAAAEAAEAAAAEAAEAAANAEAETQLAPPEEEAPRGLRPAPAVARPPPQRSLASELRRSETVAGVEDFMRSLTPDAPELRCTKAVGPTGGPSQLRQGCAVALRTTLCPIPSPSPSPSPSPNPNS